MLNSTLPAGLNPQVEWFCTVNHTTGAAPAARACTPRLPPRLQPCSQLLPGRARAAVSLGLPAGVVSGTVLEAPGTSHAALPQSDASATEGCGFLLSGRRGPLHPAAPASTACTHARGRWRPSSQQLETQRSRAVNGSCAAAPAVHGVHVCMRGLEGGCARRYPFQGAEADTDPRSVTVSSNLSDWLAPREISLNGVACSLEPGIAVAVLDPEPLLPARCSSHVCRQGALPYWHGCACRGRLAGRAAAADGPAAMQPVLACLEGPAAGTCCWVVHSAPWRCSCAVVKPSRP